MRGPRHLFGAWSEICEKARGAGQLALLVDFDGTLAPIQRRPHQVRLPASVRSELVNIARSGAVVGVVSGRELDDIRRMVGVEGIWYAGAHGLFLQDPGNRSIVLVNLSQRRRMAQVRRALESDLRSVPGIWIEDKRATVAVHYRGAASRSVAYVRARIRRVLDEFPGVHLLAGKKVWEVLPGRGKDKAAAVRLILRREKLRRPRVRRLVFYLGDDTTDESVFEKLRGISILIGRRRRTAARYFLRSPKEVARFLNRWSELRR